MIIQVLASGGGAVVKLWALIGEEWDPVTWEKDIQGKPIEVMNFEAMDSKVFILHKEIVSPL